MISITNKVSDFISGYQSSDSSKVILTFKNTSVNFFNDLSRAKKGFSDVLEIGDVLVSTQNSQVYSVYSGERFTVIELGEKKIIKNIPRGSYDAVEVTLQEVSLKSFDTGEVNEALVCLNHFTTDKPGLNQKQRQVLRIDYEERAKDRDGDIEKFYKDKTLNPLLLRYGYAMTTHRAQGHEFDDVFVHVSSVNDYKHGDSFKRRWAYTAFSRAIKRLIILESTIV